MALSALDSLDDALDATRAFLLPFSLARWLRLAVVVLFVGATGVSVPPVNVSWQVEGPVLPSGSGPDLPGPAGDLTFTEPALAVVLALAAAVVVVGLALLLVSSVMEFVLVESLRSEAVHVRAYFRRHWSRGLRLFGFRVALGLSILLAVAPVAAIALLWVGTDATPGLGWLVLVALAVPLLLVAGVVVALVNGFTSVFVVPVMLASGAGVLDGWRRLWPTVRAAWQEYGLYAVLAVVLNGVVGAAVATVAGVAGVVLAVPAAVVGLPLVVFLGWSPLSVAVLAVVGLAYLAALVVVCALALVPGKTYLRYYALFVLGDVAPDYDVIPETRDRVRGGSPPGGPGSDGASRGRGDDPTDDYPSR